MKISTRGRYGTRLMLELARHFGEGPIFLKEIAGSLGISEKYLGQLVIPMKNAGLISSVRGAHGGYSIARPPSNITLREIVEVAEGPLSLVECVSNPGVCPKSQDCVHRSVWKKVAQCMEGTLASITLQDMLEMKKESPEALFYYI